MKKFLPAILLFSCISGNAQPGPYLGFGYTVAGMKNPGLDYVVQRYNETRSWLSSKMEPIHFVQGANIGIGFKIGDFGVFDMRWVNRAGFAEASGMNGGAMQYRRLKYRLNSLNTGLMLRLMKNNGLTGLGISFDIGRDRVYTKVGTKEQLNEAKFEEINDNLLGATTLFSAFSLNFPNRRSGFTFRPFIQFILSEADYSDVDYNINNATYFNSDSDKLKGKPKNYGIEVFYHINFF